MSFVDWVLLAVVGVNFVLFGIVLYKEGRLRELRKRVGK